jgi:thioredoxin-like negative regulator of GroEL
LFYKAKILFLKAKYKETTKLLFKILQQRPNFKEANSLMAKTLMKLHKNSEAKYYERLAK